MKTFALLGRISLPVWLIIVVGILFYPEVTFGNELTINYEPRHPRPEEEVTVSLSGINSRETNIDWQIRGFSEMIRETDQRVTFTLGELGETAYVSARVTLADGSLIRESIDIKPRVVDILWEGQTYTPPFYQGRALPVENSSMTVKAVPRFSQEFPEVENYYFQWMLDGIRISGRERGLNTIGLLPDHLRRGGRELRVDIYDQDQKLVARESFAVRLSEPEVLVYKTTQEEGVLSYPHAGKRGQRIAQPKVFWGAIPFYFYIDSRYDDQLGFDWQVNGDRLETVGPYAGWQVEEEGGASVDVEVQNNRYTSQVTQTSFAVWFDNFR